MKQNIGLRVILIIGFLTFLWLEAGSIFAYADTPGYDKYNQYIDDEQKEAESIDRSGAYTYNFDSAVARKYIPDISALPKLRNQGELKDCWAHSLMFLAEVSMIKKGLANADSVDYSELAVGYFLSHTVTDPLGGTAGDSNRDGTGHLWYNGGNISYGAKALANWIGVSADALIPFSDVASIIANPSAYINSEMAYKDVCHLTGYYRINLSSDADLAKAEIINKGGIGVSYYDDDAKYNSANNCYYNDSTTLSTNHAVAIVGWDDDFDKSNFTIAPPENGAWLVRNSWYTGGDNSEKFCYSGYFWISYYDKNIANCMSFDFETASNYDNNYQYDGSFFDAFLSFDNVNSFSFSNVFETKACQYGETLEAVSFVTGNASVDYWVKVYLNPENGNPESGTLCAFASGTTSFEGYYTVTLSDSVSLNYGDRYSVVVCFEKEGAAKLGTYVESNKSGHWVESTASASSGQSFYKSGSTWLDCGESYNRNIRLKAFTVNKSAPPCQDHLWGNGTISEQATCASKGSMKYTCTRSNCNAVKYETIPVNADNHGLDTEYVNMREATVLAGGYTGDLVCSSCGEILVKGKDTPKLATTINLSLSGKVLYTCSNLNTATVKLSTNNPYTPVVWRSSNKKVAVVGQNGRITALKAGNTIITAQIGDAVAQIKIRVKDPAIGIKYKEKTVSSVTVKAGKSIGLTVSTNPQNACVTVEKLSSKDKKTVKVTLKNGKLYIKGLKEGKVIVRVKCGNITKRLTISVKK